MLCEINLILLTMTPYKTNHLIVKVGQNKFNYSFNFIFLMYLGIVHMISLNLGIGLTTK